MEIENDEKRDAMVADGLGIDLETLNELGDYEIDSLETSDGAPTGFLIRFFEDIPDEIQARISDIRDKRTAYVGINTFDEPDEPYE